VRDPHPNPSDTPTQYNTQSLQLML